MHHNIEKTPQKASHSMHFFEAICSFVGLAYYQGKKDIVFRFIIEYSSLRDFGPQVIIIGLFLYEDF